MEPLLEQRLLDEVIKETKATETARQAMMKSAAKRHEAIFSLHVNGLSVRDIAAKLECSPAVVQKAIAQARSSRPKIDRRENRVTYELHRAIAERLDDSPEEVISKGLENVSKMRKRQRSSISKDWVNTWEQLLRGNVEHLKEAMLEMSSEAEDLRQMSPFLGVLSQEERLMAIKKATKYAT